MIYFDLLSHERRNSNKTPSLNEYVLAFNILTTRPLKTESQPS